MTKAAERPTKLSVKQTIALWGGWRPGTRLNGVVSYMDTTRVARGVFDDLPSEARVATVHIGLQPFVSAGLRGETPGVIRQILAARSQLQALGFTHICVTGPAQSLITKRLVAVGTARSAGAIRNWVILTFGLQLWVGWAVLAMARKPTQVLRDIIRATRSGFLDMNVLCLGA